MPLLNCNQKPPKSTHGSLRLSIVFLAVLPGQTDTFYARLVIHRALRADQISMTCMGSDSLSESMTQVQTIEDTGLVVENLEGGPDRLTAADTGTLRCSCGNVFSDGELSCRKCGLAQPDAHVAEKSVTGHDPPLSCWNAEMANPLSKSRRSHFSNDSMGSDSKAMAPATSVKHSSTIDSRGGRSKLARSTRRSTSQLNFRRYMVSQSDAQERERQIHSGKYDIHDSDNERSRLSFISDVCSKFERICEYPVLLVIVLNGIFLGIQAQYQSTKVTQAVPQIFPKFDMIFCVVFTVELLIHLGGQGVFYYSVLREGWQWNYFDSFLVVVQLIEVAGMLTTDHESSGSVDVVNVSFLRMLRMLRLLRVLRLVRLFQFVSELKTIVSSIGHSLKSLLWTMVVLFLVIYMFGIVFTQVVLSQRIEYEGNVRDGKSAEDPEQEDMYYWWGTLFRSCLSLYEAILGGTDWDQVIWPLTQHVSIFLSPLFIVYIAFSVLAMMNVITGIFVDSALCNATLEKDKDFVDTFRAIMADCKDEKNRVNHLQFETRMSMPELQVHIRHVGINPRDAGLTFKLIDRDNVGALDLEELLAGLLRLRSNARTLDIALMVRETDEKQTRLIDYVKTVMKNIATLEKRLTFDDVEV